jgi:hypothetical protein
MPESYRNVANRAWCQVIDIAGVRCFDESHSAIGDLIQQMCQANFLWGAPRIHGEILKLGIEVAPSTVGKYLRRQRKPPS